MLSCSLSPTLLSPLHTPFLDASARCSSPKSFPINTALLVCLSSFHPSPPPAMCPKYCYCVCISACSPRKRLTDEDLAKVFSEHDVPCYYCCHNMKITGPRWKYRCNSDVSACHRHVPDKLNWRRILFPWDSSSAPNFSVALQEQGSNVRHIQCVLTKKGYLSIKDFTSGKIKVGTVDNRTCAAIGRYLSSSSGSPSAPSRCGSHSCGC